MKITDITKTQGAIGGGLVGVALVILIEASGGPDWWYLVGAGCLFAFALVYSLWPGEWHSPQPVAEPAKVECTHGVTFDPAVAKGLCVADIRRRWPRHFGKCPKGCGFSGIAYASTEHYVMGDW